jgi:hypothetical protein
MESHEIFDVDMMITPEGLANHAVATAILKPGDGRNKTISFPTLNDKLF